MDSFQQSDNKQFIDNMYQHTRYTNNIQKHQSLCLFSGNNINSDNRFRFNLTEPLKIDSISDVYLDNFTTYDIGLENSNVEAHKQFFILKIDQFNLKGCSNLDSMKNAIIIPNDDNGGNATVKVHKGKKMNYVTTLMPQTIDYITGSISDWSTNTIIQNSKIIINAVPSAPALTIILTSHFQGEDATPSSTITLTSVAGTVGPGLAGTSDAAAGTCEFSLKGTESNVATAIVAAFDTLSEDSYTLTATNNEITINATTAHTVTISGTYLTDNSGSNVTVGHPHFLAEFLIINRD